MEKEKYKLSFKDCFKNMILVLLFCFALLVPCLSYNCGYRDALIENKQIETICNDNIVPNKVKDIDIKSLNQDTTNVIDLFNIENYFTGFIYFDRGENPTIFAPGDSIVIVGFSLNVKANIDFAFDKFYISSIDYVFKSKFSQSIPLGQLMQYEYDYSREATTSGSFIYSSSASSINDLVLIENLNFFIFETNTYMQTGSMFDSNGIIFSNKISYKTLENKWHTNEFNTSPIDGFYDTNKFFSNGSFIKAIHEPNITFYANGINDLISSNYDKDYEIGYNNGYLQGEKDTWDEVPLIDKTNVAIKYIWSTITNATSSVLNIFDFDILPGIPLYAVIAVPIIIAIIFYVFKVIKK